MISEGASSAALPMRASDSPRRRIAWAAASLMAVIAGVLIALNVGGIRGHFSEPNAMGRIQSIAVLPLENLSRNPEQDYFADGMTEELINALGKVRALRVTSRTSVMRYKGTRKSLRDVAKELGVDALVEGSVLSQADRVRITAQLVDGSNDRQLWGENYERDSRNVLALQDQVASAIADGIRIQLSPQERTILSNARPVDPAAYDAYLRGRREYDDEQKSVLFFQQAIQKQPNYAAAYAGLASSYTYLDYAGTGRTEATFPKARDAAKKALELDDSLGEAHAALGWVDLRFAWNFPEAERELKRAIELNPSDTEAHHFMSHYYAAVGRLPESFDETKVALKLDPLNELLWVHLIWNYRATRQYDLGLAQIPKLLAIAPNSLSAHNMAAKLYEECDRYDEALTEFRKASELDREREPDLILALARISAAKGRKEDALKYLSRLDRVSSVKVTSPYSLAEVYARMGDRDRALSYLEAAFARRDANMSDLNLFPTFDLIREDRRFQDIVRRVGLPK
jgi:TolB-like protein/Flp pilus assembly protein TadD